MKSIQLLAIVLLQAIAFLPVSHADSQVTAANWTDASAWSELVQWFDSQTRVDSKVWPDERHQSYFGVEKDSDGLAEKACELYVGSNLSRTDANGQVSQFFVVKWLDGSHPQIESGQAWQYNDFATKPGDIDSTKVLRYSSAPLSADDLISVSGEFSVQPGLIRISGPAAVLSQDEFQLPPAPAVFEIRTDQSGSPIEATIQYGKTKETKVCHFQKLVS